MGIISNIKSKYRVKINILWIINLIFISLSSAIFIFSFILCLINSKVTGARGIEKIFFCSVMILSLALNVIAFFCNRKYVNTPISIVAAVGMCAAVYMIFMYMDILVCKIVPTITIAVDVAAIIMEWKMTRQRQIPIKIAKVKLDFDFKPEDIIEEYRLSLKEIEKRYDMGDKDREAFEKEKSELLSDTHHILKEFIGNRDVVLLDKIETLYQAKRECIITEDNYILWKNHLLKNEKIVDELIDETKYLFKNNGISQEVYNHRMELLKNEF